MRRISKMNQKQQNKTTEKVTDKMRYRKEAKIKNITCIIEISEDKKTNRSNKMENNLS